MGDIIPTATLQSRTHNQVDQLCGGTCTMYLLLVNVRHHFSGCRTAALLDNTILVIGIMAVHTIYITERTSRWSEKDRDGTIDGEVIFGLYTLERRHDSAHLRSTLNIALKNFSASGHLTLFS